MVTPYRPGGFSFRSVSLVEGLNKISLDAAATSVSIGLAIATPVTAIVSIAPGTAPDPTSAADLVSQQGGYALATTLALTAGAAPCIKGAGGDPLAQTLFVYDGAPIASFLLFTTEACTAWVWAFTPDLSGRMFSQYESITGGAV